MSRIKVEVIKTNEAGEQYVENYYFVDPKAAVAFANFTDDHATVIDHHGAARHVSAAVNAAAEIVNKAIEDTPEPVVEPVAVEVTVDAEAAPAEEPVTDAPAKKSRKK